MCLSTVNAFCKEPNDSTTKVHELEEVVVKGSSKKLSINGMTCIPTREQTRASLNGYELLSRLGIPMLDVNPVLKTIKTIHDHDVKMFINGVPATPDDLKGLKPTDVLQVLYLEYPDDPKYGGADYVVNYILKELEWGGYTKLYAADWFLNVPCDIKSSVFSKFKYKSMTFDFFGGWNYNNAHHGGNNETERYMLTDDTGSPFEAVRHTEVLKSKYRTYNIPAMFRAIYDSQKVRIINTIGVSFNRHPDSYNIGSIDITPLDNNTYTYNTYNTGIWRDYSWNGSLLLILPRDYSLNITGSASYSHNNSNNIYSTSIPNSSTIENGRRENGWGTTWSASAKKRLNADMSVNLDVNASYSSSDSDYFGSSPFTSSYSYSQVYGIARFTYRHDNMDMFARVGGAWERTSMNGHNVYFGYPFIHLNWAYTPSRQHRFSALLGLTASNSGADSKSENVIQQNEFLYITGNPYLKSWTEIDGNFSYTWNPSEQLSLTGLIVYVCNFKPSVSVFDPYLDGTAVIRNILNSGWEQYIRGALNVTYKPIPQLQIQGSCKYVNRRLTGVTPRTFNGFSWSLIAYYYLKDFNFSIAYIDQGSDMDITQGITIKQKPFYYISCGWNKGAWNLQCVLADFLRDNWRLNNSILSTPYYSFGQSHLDVTLHRCIELSVSYTFGYGKPVQRGDEIGTQGGAHSIIMQ